MKENKSNKSIEGTLNDKENLSPIAELSNFTDPIGAAIFDYVKTKKPDDIIVCSDICDDDIIPIEVLFRSYDEMPELEKLALSKCKGKILDVGAGAGSHAMYLQDLGLDVTTIDVSEGAVKFMKDNGLKAECVDFFKHTGKYDTILMMMNGIGIAGKLSNLERTLIHAKNMLKPGGRILCDSSDIKYLYEDEDGALWVDLNSEYYGNFRFQMKYKKQKGKWFNWLYVDFDNLFKVGKKVGLKPIRIYEEDDNYLAELSID